MLGRAGPDMTPCPSADGHHSSKRVERIGDGRSSRGVRVRNLTTQKQMVGRTSPRAR